MQAQQRDWEAPRDRRIWWRNEKKQTNNHTGKAITDSECYPEKAVFACLANDAFTRTQLQKQTTCKCPNRDTKTLLVMGKHH